MRDILFRVWDGNRMTNKIRLEFAHGLRLVSVDDLGFDMVGDDKCVLMQSTGLKDKNGVLIYEGDIVKVYKAEDYVDNPKEELEDEDWNERNSYICTEKVEYGNSGYYIKSEKAVDMFEYCPAIGSEEIIVEIIGNIYENPELLSPQSNS